MTSQLINNDICAPNCAPLNVTQCMALSTPLQYCNCNACSHTLILSKLAFLNLYLHYSYTFFTSEVCKEDKGKIFPVIKKIKYPWRSSDLPLVNFWSKF